MAFLVVRQFRGHRYLSIRDGRGRQVEWLGRNPSPERLKAAILKHGVDVRRYARMCEEAINANR